MWSGPVLYHGSWFVTCKHAIVTTKLSICSHLPEDKLPKLVLQYVGVDPFKAKCFGKEMSVRSFLPLWEEKRVDVVYEIIMSVAFTDATFLYHLFDPYVTKFTHVLLSQHLTHFDQE